MFKKGCIPWNKAKKMLFKKRKPHTQEWKDNHSAWLKANPQSPWLGKKMPLEMRLKMSSSRVGYRHTKETKEKIAASKRGAKSYSWKGGRVALTKVVRFSYPYRLWRTEVFERDKWTCQNCKRVGSNLAAHHIKPFAMILGENKITNIGSAMRCKELWDINNGVTLCEECHNLTKKGRIPDGD